MAGNGYNLFCRDFYRHLDKAWLEATVAAWLKTPVAREHGVKTLRFASGDSREIEEVAISVSGAKDGDRLVLPAEDLVEFVLKRSGKPPAELAAERAHLKDFWGKYPEVFRYWIATPSKRKR